MQISKQKYKELEKELKYLENEGYQKVLEEEKAAGGPMESFHQTASAMEERKRWNLRVKEIKRILKEAKIIDKTTSKDLIEIGSEVTLEINQTQVIYMLVESIEADPLKNKISIESELGKSLIGKKVGDKIEIKVEGDKVNTYKIIRIN